jgi:hypothetical protein
MAQVLSLTEKIAQSKRASAVERAWQVAKALEGDRTQIEGLQWVEPEKVEGRGITRRVDFSEEFPDGITYVTPVPMNISVVAPASKLVPSEDIPVAWTMPVLTRMSPYEGSLDTEVRNGMGFSSSPSMRHRVDAVSFLPFPKVDTDDDKSFNPEFMVTLKVDADLGKPDNYFAAVAKYGGKVIRQMVTGGYPKFLGVYADPQTQTHFSAKMLVNLGAEELASTAEGAGELEIFVYRITTGGYDLGKLISAEARGLGDVLDFSGNFSRGSTYGGDFLGGGLKGGGDFLGGATRGGSFRELSELPSVPRRPTVSPSSTPKEVGDVKLGEGARGERVEYNTLSGYVADTGFGVQPIRIRFLGVREASQDATLGALHEMAQRY